MLIPSMSLPGGHKDALSGCTRLLRIVVLLSEMYLIACGAKCFVLASHRASYEVRSEVTVLWYTYSNSPVSEIYRFWEVFTYHTLQYSSSCFYILCRLDMDRKRCSVSRELLSYKSLFRGINDPKYNFRSPIPRKRAFCRRRKPVSLVHNSLEFPFYYVQFTIIVSSAVT